MVLEELILRVHEVLRDDVFAAVVPEDGFGLVVGVGASGDGCRAVVNAVCEQNHELILLRIDRKMVARESVECDGLAAEICGHLAEGLIRLLGVA